MPASHLQYAGYAFAFLSVATVLAICVGLLIAAVTRAESRPYDIGDEDDDEDYRQNNIDLWGQIADIYSALHSLGWRDGADTSADDHRCGGAECCVHDPNAETIAAFAECDQLFSDYGPALGEYPTWPGGLRLEAPSPQFVSYPKIHPSRIAEPPVVGREISERARVNFGQIQPHIPYDDID